MSAATSHMASISTGDCIAGCDDKLRGNLVYFNIKILHVMGSVIVREEHELKDCA